MSKTEFNFFNGGKTVWVSSAVYWILPCVCASTQKKRKKNPPSMFCFLNKVEVSVDKARSYFFFCFCFMFR